MDSSVQGAQRTVDRVVGELGRVQDIGDALRADTEKRLQQQKKMLNVFKTDLEARRRRSEVAILGAIYIVIGHRSYTVYSMYIALGCVI